MLLLRTPPAARARSSRRWAAGAVIAAILLADVPRAHDLTPDRVPDRTPDADGPCRVCDPADGVLPSLAPIALPTGAPAGTSRRSPLRHVIGL